MNKCIKYEHKLNTNTENRQGNNKYAIHKFHISLFISLYFIIWPFTVQPSSLLEVPLSSVLCDVTSVFCSTIIVICSTSLFRLVFKVLVGLFPLSPCCIGVIRDSVCPKFVCCNASCALSSVAFLCRTDTRMMCHY